MRVYLAGSMFTPYERSFLDGCAARLRAEGFEVFVPHEQTGLVGLDVTAEAVFAVDAAGVESADAVLAVLDGPSVDDGTACEIGLFHGLKQRDPERKGVVGLLTDMRAERRGDFATNLGRSPRASAPTAGRSGRSRPRGRCRRRAPWRGGDCAAPSSGLAGLLRGGVGARAGGRAHGPPWRRARRRTTPCAARRGSLRRR